MKDTSVVECRERELGFSLIEVMVSILITLVVMSAVFALLSRGQRSFDREPEVADLQQSARNAIDAVSKDIMQAGAGLPPEFPAFGTPALGAGDGNPTDTLFIVGAVQSASGMVLEPESVAQVTTKNGTVTMFGDTTNFLLNDIVAVYNNQPNNVNPEWFLARVISVVQNPGNQAFVNIAQDIPASIPYALYDSPTFNPASFITDVNAGTPGAFMTKISITQYNTIPDASGTFAPPVPEVLQRTVTQNAAIGGVTNTMGYLQDFEIGYTVGVNAPVEQNNPPVLIAGAPCDNETMVSSVRISVTGRSISSNLQGAIEGGGGTTQDDFLRKTFSMNVNPRNITAGFMARTVTGGCNLI